MTVFIRSVFFLVLSILILSVPSAQAGASDQYAWSENTGWQNFQSTHGRVKAHTG